MKAVVFLIVTLLTFGSLGQEEELADDVVPTYYSLTMKIQLIGQEADTYTGVVQISLKCNAATNTFRLHADETRMKVNREKIKIYRENDKPNGEDYSSSESDDEIKILSTSTLGKDVLEITLENSLVQDKMYVLEIKFSGTISHSFGWVKVDSLGKPLIATDLKRSLARTVFPCFDSHSIRTPFQVGIVRRREAVSFSNSILHTTKAGDDNEWKWDVYGDMILSPYQVLIVVTEMPLKEYKISDGFVCVEPQYAGICQLILPYQPSSKQNQARSLPMQDHSEGVNFIFIPGEPRISIVTKGVILKSIRDLLKGRVIDGDRMNYFLTSNQVRQRLEASLVWSPEYHSAWAWWASHWLTTSLGQHISLSHTSQSFRNMEIVREMLSAMKADGKTNAKSVNFIYNDDGSLQQEVLPETLSKGLLLMRMFSNVAGETQFTSAVNEFSQYLRTYYVNPLWMNDKKRRKGRDYFWNYLPICASNIFFRAIISVFTTTGCPFSMDQKSFIVSWIDQEGIPLIEVMRDGNYIKIFQRSRFFNKESESDSKPDEKQCWWVPVTYVTAADQTSHLRWVGCNNAVKIKVKRSDWIIVNDRMSGYYRVLYDQPNWQLISEVLNDEAKFQQIDVLNRAQLINDVLVLSFNRQLYLEDAFQLVWYMRHEKQPEGLPVWHAYFDGIESYKTYVTSPELINLFKTFQKKLLTAKYVAVFPHPDPVENPEPAEVIRILAISQYDPTEIRIHEESCLSGVELCSAQSSMIYNAVKSQMDSFKSDTGNFMDLYTSASSKGILQSVLCMEMKRASDEEIQFVLGKLQNEWKNNKLRGLYVKALKCTNKEKSVILRVLEWSTADSGNEDIEERLDVFKGLLAGTETMFQAAEYFYVNYDTIQTRFSSWATQRKDDPWNGFLKIMACELDPEKLNQIISTNSRNENIIKLLNLNGMCDGLKRLVKFHQDEIKKVLESLLSGRK